MKHTALAPALFTLLVIALTSGCTPEPELPAEQLQPVRVVSAAPAGQAADSAVHGLVAARDELRLAFKAGGVISRLTVNEGDAIRAGQVLAELAAAEVDAQLTQAREQAAKAARDLARAEDLFARGLIARQPLEDARTAADITGAQLAAAEFNRAHARIVAPGDGVVLRRLAEPGETVAAGTSILIVANTARGWVLRAGVPDQLAVQLKKGDPATVFINAWPERPLPARILEIAAASDSVTGTLAVEVGFDSTAIAPRSGMVGRALLHPRAGTATNAGQLVIPVGAILEGDGQRAHVFVLDGDKQTVRRADISTGWLAGSEVTVTGGLNAGDQVVSEGAAWLLDGQRVRVIP